MTNAITDTKSRLGLNVLTHSSTTCWKSCPRKFELQYRVGLVPSHSSDALRIGTCFHAGLDLIKNNTDLADAVQAIRQMYADATLPPWMTADDFLVEEETVVALISGWADKWSGDTIIEYVAVELKFDLPLINPDSGRPSRLFRNQGKIDGIGKLPDGRLAIVEHKTAGVPIEPTADYWRKLTMDAQVSRYILAARALGYDVATIAYDVTKKPSIKPKAVAKADRAYATSEGHYFGLKLTGECPAQETPTMYGARLRDDMQQRPDFYFARMEVARTDKDLQRFAKEQWMLAQQVALADRSNSYPRNTDACLSPYKCSYFDVCTSGIEPTETNIPAGFKIQSVLNPELATQPHHGAENPS